MIAEDIYEEKPHDLIGGSKILLQNDLMISEVLLKYPNLLTPRPNKLPNDFFATYSEIFFLRNSHSCLTI